MNSNMKIYYYSCITKRWHQSVYIRQSHISILIIKILYVYQCCTPISDNILCFDILWPFIIEIFESSGKQISSELSERICTTVKNYSAYVQQLAWNILTMSGDVVDDTSFNNGLEATLAQVIPLFVENYIRPSLWNLVQARDDVDNAFLEIR